MIQINLIPDVKRDLLRAQAMRNLVIFASIVVTGVAAAAVVLTFLFIGGQNLLMDNKDKEIKTEFTKLTQIPDIDQVIILQNQLSEISKIRNASPNFSRLLIQVLTAIKTEGDNAVEFSGVGYDEATRTITIEGQTGATVPNGFAALEGFQKTIPETLIAYREDDGTCSINADGTATNDKCQVGDLAENKVVNVLEQSYGENEDGAKTTRFKVSFVLNSAALKFSTKGFVVKSPSRKDVTDSRTKIPDDIFSAESNSEGGTN